MLHHGSQKSTSTADESSPQIRKEAGAIFYVENNFQLVIHDWESTVAQRWPRRLLRCAEESGVQPKEKVSIHVSDSANWENLVEWLRAFHRDDKGVVAPGFYPALRTDRMVIASMFHMVWRTACKRWEVVEKVMLEQRVILARLDARWED